LTASYALNGGGSGTGFPYSGSARITGSLDVTGSVTATSFSGSLYGTGSWALNAVNATNATAATSAVTATSATNLSSIQIVQSGSTVSSTNNVAMFAGSGRIPTGLTASPAITVTGLTGTLFYNVFVTATATASAALPGQPPVVMVKSLAGNQLTFEGTNTGPYDFSFVGMYLI
jgi:hypothetical protein